MINITFGETVINTSNATIDRLIISRDVINNIVYKTVFLVVKDTSIIINNMNEIKTLLIEDPVNNLTIFNNSMILQNMEINENNNIVFYQYTFREAL